MNKISLLILITLLAQSCGDSARSSRRTSSNSNGNNNSNAAQSPYYTNYGNETVNIDGSTDGTTDGSTDGSTDGTTDPTGTSIPQDATHCTWSSDGVNSFQLQSTILGDYNFCNSTTTDKVYLQVKNAPSERVCIIPMTKLNGSTNAIGNALCNDVSNNSIIPYQLATDRQGYGAETFNIAAILKFETNQYSSWVYANNPYYGQVNQLQAFDNCILAISNICTFRDQSGSCDHYCQIFEDKQRHIFLNVQ